MLRQLTSRSNDLFDIMPLYLTQYIERLGTGTGEMIRKLRELEVIVRVGPAKGGHWEVLE